MNRTGWAAAVGSLYKTRAGHVLVILEYLVTYSENHPITEMIQGGVGSEDGFFMRIHYGADGCCRYIVGKPDATPEYRADFDLISAVQPAQVTKIIKCKDDLATRPQEGTAPATVVPRKDLP